MNFFKRLYVFLMGTKRRKIIFYSLISLAVVAVVATVAVVLLSSPEAPSVEVDGSLDETVERETVTEETESLENEETNTQENAETEDIVTKDPVFVRGIDVSRWQGTVDWAKVKAAGIEFAMIRIGAYDDSGCTLDSKAIYNLQQAEKNGVLAGVYFYSGAKLPQDARKEAQWVLDQIAGFSISYPVVLDWEMDSYKKDVSAAVRTDTALAFLQEVENAGYEAMLYTPQADFESGELWEKERILGKYPVWVARYSDPKYPEVSYPDGKRDYAMWQYSDGGKIDGISGNVDLNVAYFEREYTPPKNAALRPSEEDTPIDFKQTFQKVNISLTAKDEVNLRKIPSMEGEIVSTLRKGEFLECTGIGDMGWARLIYQGKEVYAVYSYLTETAPEDDPAEDFKQTFSPASLKLTAKEIVNLRKIPSVDGELVGVLNKGEFLDCTGISDMGWARLIYEGKEVYAVYSYLTETA